MARILTVHRSDTPRDYYQHLPTLEQWSKAAESAYDLLDRAEQAHAAYKLLAGPADIQYAWQDGFSAIRVGYDPKNDCPMFIAKGDKGLIYVASYHLLDLTQ